MFRPSSKCLRFGLVFQKKASTNKWISNDKANIIKHINTENKYLFGGLLETQKQRRKRTSEPSLDESNTIEKSDSSDNASVDVKLDNTAMKKTKVQKLKISTDHNICTTDTKKSPTDSNSLQKDSSKPSLCLNTKYEKEISVDDSKKSRKRKTSGKTGNSENIDQVNKNNLSIASKLNSDEFVFRSAVSINEANYPLSSSEKLGIYTHKCHVENVLKFSFSDQNVKNYLKFPSVSKIMEDTMSQKNKLILNKWRQNMVADMGEEGFSKHFAAVKSRGHEFHSAVCDTVMGLTVDTGSMSETTQKGLQSLEWLLPLVRHPLAVESLIAHPHLGYKGIPDCVAMFRELPVVIDWKLSDKPKKSLKDTYEAPVQITAYIGALNHDPNYKWTVSHGLLAVAYASGDPCDVFLLAPKHCEIYWRHWLLRLDKFNSRTHLHLDHNIDEKALEFV